MQFYKVRIDEQEPTEISEAELHNKLRVFYNFPDSALDEIRQGAVWLVDIYAYANSKGALYNYQSASSRYT